MPGLQVLDRYTLRFVLLDAGRPRFPQWLAGPPPAPWRAR
jgi:hypothetical protein